MAARLALGVAQAQITHFTSLSETNTVGPRISHIRIIYNVGKTMPAQSTRISKMTQDVSMKLEKWAEDRRDQADELA